MLKSLNHVSRNANHLLTNFNKQDGIIIANQFVRFQHVELSKNKFYKLEEGPPTTAELTKEDALKYYEDMSIIRKMEQAASRLYLSKHITGFLHLCSGQEACYVGMRAAMAKEDDCISAYRVHGLVYAMGASVKQVLAELCGRVTGVSRGKGGSMHMYYKHFYGGNGIVGAQIPIGTGVAFANKYLKKGTVCFNLYGDGASNQGQCYEAFNMAAIWKLPCVYVCENNGYAMGTSVARHSAMKEFYMKGHYIPGLWVNGMDVLSVRESCKFAREYVLKEGPIVLEFATYRYFGHSMSDPGSSYRTREEVQEVRKKRDCIKLLEKRILEHKIATKDELKKVDKKCTALVKQAIKESKTDPTPALEEIASDVYSSWKNEEYGKIRGTVEWKPFLHKRIGPALNFK